MFDRAIALIRPRDGQPMMLRIGGKSADHVWWQTATSRPPQWVTKIGDTWLGKLARLVGRDDLRVLLDLNLAVHSASLESAFATATASALPVGGLAGLEIGNEPDLYWRQPSLERQQAATTDPSVPPHWTSGYAPVDYRRDYSAYARALKRALPGIPLIAPEIISAKAPWLDAVDRLGSLAPSAIAVHRYASSSCWPIDSQFHPTIPLMLREAATAGLAGTVAPAVSFAHTRRMALWLTEMNSVSCGGNAGVADSFATALWAPDALFEMIRAGVDRVSWHLRPDTRNAPFQVNRGSIKPLPALYGLALFAEMTHGPATLLNASVTEATGLHLKAWVVRKGGSLTALLINKGPRAADVTMAAPGGANERALLRRLLARSIGASGGVTYGGRSIGSDARWHGRNTATVIRALHGLFHITVPAYSAATLTL